MALDILFYILFFIFAVFAAQALHEFGHILGGFTQGYEFRFLTLGPFFFRKSRNGKLSFGIEKDRTLWQGASVTLPKDPMTMTSKQLTVILLSGLILSVIAGLAFAPLAMQTRNYYAIVVSVLNLSFGIASFFPAKRSAAFSDGWSLANFKRGDTVREEEVRFYRITRTFTADTDTENIAFEDLDILSRSKDRIRRFVAACFMYRYYDERGEKPSAKNAMKQIELIYDKVPRRYFKKYCLPLGVRTPNRKKK